jgi:hypothetical protein
MASIEKRTRNGRVSYSVRYRDPAGRSRRRCSLGRSTPHVGWPITRPLATGCLGRSIRRPRPARRVGRAVVLHRGPAARDPPHLSLAPGQPYPPHLGGAALASIDPLAVHEWQAGLVAGGRRPQPEPRPQRRPGVRPDPRRRGGGWPPTPQPGPGTPPLWGASVLPRLDGVADWGGGGPPGSGGWICSPAGSRWSRRRLR